MKPNFDFNGIIYTLAFLIPGFIFFSSRMLFTKEKIKNIQLSLLGFVTYSFISLALFFTFLLILNRLCGYGPRTFTGLASLYFIVNDYFVNHPLLSIAWATIWFLIVPFMFGSILGNLSSRKIIREFLYHRFGLELFDSRDTSWEMLFSDAEEQWIFVTLKDDKKIYGYWGLQSFASSDVNHKDLYIEQLYEPDEEGNLQINASNHGMWIPGGEIKYIEVLKLGSELNGDT